LVGSNIVLCICVSQPGLRLCLAVASLHCTLDCWHTCVVSWLKNSRKTDHRREYGKEGKKIPS
jgi:hypothetical protein